MTREKARYKIQRLFDSAASECGRGSTVMDVFKKFEEVLLEQDGDLVADVGGMSMQVDGGKITITFGGTVH